MATSLLSDEKRREILELKGDKEKFKYDVLKKRFGFVFYIKDKELFGVGKVWTYSGSRKFKLPN